MLSLSSDDLDALWLTFKLASTVTLLLIIVATPLAWWLATTRNPLKAAVSAVIALPLVLPPTVLGFYLLIAMAPSGFIGHISESLGLGQLAFSFGGLVLASMLYSLPFVVQPLQNAMAAIGKRPLEVAATLGANRVDRFVHIVLPMAKPGYLSAAILGFTHTVGEFGVVLMIGGNIPQQTQVVSVQLYDHVETLAYDQAHGLAALLIGFSFCVLLVLFYVNRDSGLLGKPWR